VAQFVAGISRLHLIKAHSVMGSIGEYQSAHPADDVASLVQTDPEADIDELINLTLGSTRDGVAVVDRGSIVGIVTPRSLLRGVKGAQASEPAPAQLRA
jgi:glycine betaine/proline transport system ATP-binding protein